jgi:hypothetical protein
VIDRPPPSIARSSRSSSQRVGRRNEGVTAAQALALRNSGFTLAPSRLFAARVEREAGAFVGAHGLPAFCRQLLQCNEFLFVD